MTHITVTIKFLNGDLMEIQHTPSCGFDQLVSTIYGLCKDIPYGCLVLKRAPYDELDEVAQLMFLSEIYSDHDDSVLTEVYDGDELFALVDTTLVIPVVNVTAIVSTIVNAEERCLTELHIPFFSTEAQEKNDHSFRYSVRVFYDEKNKLFALKDTFHAPRAHEFVEYNGEGWSPLYYPTNDTQWFLSVIECLESVPHTRFPKDRNTLGSIHKQITERAWEKWGQYENNYGVDYDEELDLHEPYDDADDIRERNYEAQRWNRRR